MLQLPRLCAAGAPVKPPVMALFPPGPAIGEMNHGAGQEIIYALAATMPGVKTPVRVTVISGPSVGCPCLGDLYP